MANNRAASVLLHCPKCDSWFQAVTVALSRGRKCSAIAQGRICGGELRVAKVRRTAKQKRLAKGAKT